jgi:hypothetical protein
VDPIILLKEKRSEGFAVIVTNSSKELIEYLFPSVREFLLFIFVFEDCGNVEKSRD